MTKVEIDMSKAYGKLSDEAITKGRRNLANQAMADMNRYVPAKEYILRNTVTLDIDGSSINYNTPYAKKQFYNRAKKYTTPGTGPRWDLKAKNNHMKAWEKAFRNGANW